jgi:hypothetical protein
MSKPIIKIPKYLFIYCSLKVILFSSCLFSVHFNSKENVATLAIFSFIFDIVAILFSIRFFRSLNLKSKVLPFALLFSSCLILSLYPIAWDDLSYGLTLPKIFLAQGSFKPISEYGVFTYFPLIEYSRTLLTFAFGETLQILFYRIESLALYLSSFSLLILIYQKGLTKAVSDEYKFYCILLVMTTVSAFSVYGFVKAESFVNTCFLAAILAYLSTNRINAILITLIAIPFKYTTIFTGLPIFVMSVLGLRKQFVKPGLFLLIGVCSVFASTILWMLNNYSYTGVPLYPLLIKYFTYSGDGLINANEYAQIMKTLLDQHDVSILTIRSYKYIKYLFTQIGGLLILIPLFLPLILKKKFQSCLSNDLRMLTYGFALALVIFILILFNEFRYIYILISFIMLSYLMMIKTIIPAHKEKFLFRLLIVIIIFQLFFVVIRNFRNSTYDFNLSVLPINLAIEQKQEIRCIRSFSAGSSRVATFEQTFFLWKSPFFFIHELNEYIGLDPTADNIKYAFDKFNVKYILLPDLYRNEEFLNDLDIGGNSRLMPKSVLKKINLLYTLDVIDNSACKNTFIFHLTPK